MEHQADVIIVGTGVAGLFCALQLPKELHILLSSKYVILLACGPL